MIYGNEVIEKETIEELAKNCFETGAPAVVGIDWSNEDNAEYHTICIGHIHFVPIATRLTFYDGDRADSVAKDINNYAEELIKRGKVSPKNNKHQESNPFAEINYFNIFDDELPI